jgi:hypothetical protein
MARRFWSEVVSTCPDGAKLVVQSYLDVFETKIDFRVCFGNLSSNNLDNCEYNVSVKCPCCSSVLELCVN